MSSEAARPRLGIFLTMIVALILFFGLLAHVGRFAREGGFLSAPVVQIDENTDALKEARRKTLVRIGGKVSTPNLPEKILEETDEGIQIPVNPMPAHQQNKNTKPKYYVVKPGQTLYSISKYVYGNGALWPKIQAANPGLSPATLEAGKMITIPNPRSFKQAHLASGSATPGT